MEFIILLILFFGLLISIFYLYEGKKQSYKNINADLNKDYYKNFKDWRLEFKEIQDSNAQESNFSGTVISFGNLSRKDKHLASTLGIKSNFDYNLLKKSFREKILQNHPDKLENANKTQTKEANKRCIEINKAYKILSRKFD